MSDRRIDSMLAEERDLARSQMADEIRRELVGWVRCHRTEHIPRMTVFSMIDQAARAEKAST